METRVKRRPVELLGSEKTLLLNVMEVIKNFFKVHRSLLLLLKMVNFLRRAVLTTITKLSTFGSRLIMLLFTCQC